MTNSDLLPTLFTVWGRFFLTKAPWRGRPLLKMNYRCIAKTFLIAGELCCGRSMDDIANLLLCEV
jgi:hypothetical protein